MAPIYVDCRRGMELFVPVLTDQEEEGSKPGYMLIGQSPWSHFPPTKLHLLKDPQSSSHQLGRHVQTQEPGESFSNHNTVQTDGHVEQGRSCPTVSKLIRSTHLDCDN